VQPPLLVVAHSWLERRGSRHGGPGGMHSMPPPSMDSAVEEG
jgi:hypothetical protein